MHDLITLAEYKAFDTTTPATDDTLLNSLITASTDVIERHCNRTFTQHNYDEIYDGNSYRQLSLDHFPILSIDRIACNPTNVLTVKNTSAIVSRATVKVTSTGISLVSIASAFTTTTPLLFATYTTLSSLATAINAVSGWTATVTDNYWTYPSAELRAVQGSLNAKGVDASLILHTEDISNFRVEEATGLIDYPSGFGRGAGNWRVIYTANFPIVPESIKQACREIVKASYNVRRLDANLISESLGVWSWTKDKDSPDIVGASFGQLSVSSRVALARYRVVMVPKYKQEGVTWRH